MNPPPRGCPEAMACPVCLCVVLVYQGALCSHLFAPFAVSDDARPISCALSGPRSFPRSGFWVSHPHALHDAHNIVLGRKKGGTCMATDLQCRQEPTAGHRTGFQYR